MLANLISEGRLELMSQFVHVDPEAGPAGILLGCAGHFDHFEGRVCELGVQDPGASGYTDTFGRRACEDAQLLKCALDGGCHLGGFFLVGLRGGVEHDKERKQKSDEVGVGDEPALVVCVRLVFSLTAHALAPAAFSFYAGACCMCSGR